MPVDPNAAVRITAFKWVPPFARGQVRDLRVRWALEEAGIPYAVRKLDATHDRPQEYYSEQPWGQVPSYNDGTVQLFESGAIVLHIGKSCPEILPTDEEGAARATAWLIAALNSVEPHLMQLGLIDIFYKDEEWAKLRRPSLVEFVEQRLDRLVDWLGDKEWLEDRFTVGDMLMVSVLRGLDHIDIVAKKPTLAAYKARGEERPAFQAALAAQLADFEERPTATA